MGGALCSAHMPCVCIIEKRKNIKNLVDKSGSSRYNKQVASDESQTEYADVLELVDWLA